MKAEISKPYTKCWWSSKTKIHHFAWRRDPGYRNLRRIFLASLTPFWKNSCATTRCSEVSPVNFSMNKSTMRITWRITLPSSETSFWWRKKTSCRMFVTKNSQTTSKACSLMSSKSLKALKWSSAQTQLLIRCNNAAVWATKQQSAKTSTSPA